MDVRAKKNLLFGNVNICTATANNIVVVAQGNYITVFSDCFHVVDLQNQNHRIINAINYTSMRLT